jgi:hypothetical protein
VTIAVQKNGQSAELPLINTPQRMRTARRMLFLDPIFDIKERAAQRVFYLIQDAGRRQPGFVQPYRYLPNDAFNQEKKRSDEF